MRKVQYVWVYMCSNWFLKSIQLLLRDFTHFMRLNVTKSTLNEWTTGFLSPKFRPYSRGFLFDHGMLWLDMECPPLVSRAFFVKIAAFYALDIYQNGHSRHLMRATLIIFCPFATFNTRNFRNFQFFKNAFLRYLWYLLLRVDVIKLHKNGRNVVF